MHLTRFYKNGNAAVGAIEGDEVVDLSSRFATMSEAISAAAAGVRIDAAGLPRYSRADTVLAPVVDPDSVVVGIALNYAGHVNETKNRTPARPVTFFKPYTTLVGDKAAIAKPRVVEKFDYEGEIGIVIGREVYDAGDEEAEAAIWGITAVNDVTARDLLRIPPDKDSAFRDWVSSKALEKTTPIGPCIVPLEEVRSSYDDGSLSVETFLNGKRVQNGSINQLLISCTDLVKFMSTRLRLRPGDVIATGTPEGVGNALGRLLQDGDTISVQVSGLPLLSNSVTFALPEAGSARSKG
jgi:acylpyruvate hydrolase